jgi:HhH-GPD superfamily base excision DNA repair protein
MTAEFEPDAAARVPRAKHLPRGRTRPGDLAVADPAAREFLRRADPILRELIDARPDFHPRAWLSELPRLDAFGTLIFEVVGQQLSVNATRTIVSHLRERFGGHLPSPQELLAVDAKELRAARMSTRKGATLRALAAGASPTGQRQDRDHVISDRPTPPMQEWLTGAAIGQVLPLHACTGHSDLVTACGERQ